MKKIITLTAVVLGLAAPAFAQTQLERSLDVDAGVYTTSQLAQLAAVQSESGYDRNIKLNETDNVVVSSRSLAAPTVHLSAENGDDRRLANAPRTVYTYAPVNDKAAEIFARIFAENNFD